MGIEKYNEEEFNDWVITHADWMRKNLPVSLVEGFEGEIEGLINDTDRHAFMLFHLLNMSTLDDDNNYKYLELAKQTWALSIPMVQAFNTMTMRLAQTKGDEETLHAVGLANALMMRLFTTPPPIQGDEEE